MDFSMSNDKTVNFINTDVKVLVVPYWVMETLSKNVQIESILNFDVMKEQFNLDQLLAIYEFSKTGMTVFYNGVRLSDKRDFNYRNTNSFEDAWLLSNNTTNDNLRQDLLKLSENKNYVESIVSEHIFNYLEDDNTEDLNLTYPFEIYALENGFFVLALKKGILNLFKKNDPNSRYRLTSYIYDRLGNKIDEKKGSGYQNKTQWFYWYLKDLEIVCNMNGSTDQHEKEISMDPTSLAQ